MSELFRRALREAKVDQKHIAFHEECIDHDYGMRDAQPQVIMIPGWIARAMDWTDPPVAAVDFQPRELIYRRLSRGDSDPV